MDSPWIWQWLRREPPCLLLLICHSCYGCLQAVNSSVKVTFHPIYSLVQGAFYIFNFFVQLSIDAFLLLPKISHHLAQIQNGLLNRRRGGWLLLLCSWGNICWRLRLPGEVRVTPQVGVVSVAIWSICLRIVLAHHICILRMGVWTWFSWVVSGLAVETVFYLCMAFSHCLHLM